MAGVQEAPGAIESVSAVEVDAPDIETPQEAPASEAVVQPEPAPETLKESARQTVSRLAKELSGEKAPPKEDSVEPKVVKEAKAKPVKDLTNDDDKYDPNLIVPDRLSPEAKAVFSKLPKELKRDVNRTLKDLEGITTRNIQQAQQVATQAKGIIDAVQPFAADWAKRHVSIPAGVGELCAMYQRLANPQTAAQEYLELGHKLGVNFDQLAQAVKTGQLPAVGQSQNNFSSTELNDLREEQKRLTSIIEQQQTSQAIAPIVAEMKAVQQEVDPATGQLRYPELNDADYLRSLQPRVSELVGTIPGLSHGEALVRANQERKQKLFNMSPGVSVQPNQTRLSGANNQTQQRAISAAVTVRGRTTPLLSNNAGQQEPPPEALKSAKATTAWVLKNLQNGGG